jgi:F-type H+-transporting ATPase subunit delta
VRQSIRGYTDGVIEESTTAELKTTASELEAVVGLVAGSEDLRRILADPGVSLVSRRTVLTDLLSAKVGRNTLRLLVFVIDSDRATEVAANLDWLAGRFTEAVEDRHPVGGVVLGQKAAEERVGGFAAALVDSNDSQDVLSRIEDELYSFHQILEDNDELRLALTNRDVPADSRQKLVVDLLKPSAHATTTALAAYATQVGRPRDYVGLIGYLAQYIAAEGNRRVADVRSAIELDDAQRANLSGALSRAIGHDVQLRVTVDPSVIAGFVAVIGDTVVDGSARHRLELLKERLILPEAKATTGEPS